MSRRTAADHFSQSRFQTSSISSGLMYFLNEHQFWEEISRTRKAVTAFSILSLLAELRWLEGPQSGAPYSHRKKGNPWVDFIMVIMASSIARGRVRTTTAKQGICWQYHVTIPGLKFAARVFFWSWPLTKCWFSTGSRDHVRLTCWKRVRIVRKPVNADPGFKVNRIILLLCFVYMVIITTQNRRPNNIQNTSPQSHIIKSSTFSWVSLIKLWTTRPRRSYAFRLA